MILTEDELEGLTDYRKPACQKRWLAEHGIPFVEGASGKPKVLRAEVERSLGSGGDAGRGQPNFDALRKAG